MKIATVGRTLSVVVVLVAGALTLHARRVEEPAAGGFAVVELFTSEGCSSCPPADAALSDLIRGAAEKHQAVYALAFHVDYWDRLGWADPFASASFTARQRTYAQKLKLDGLYTPQMVVNGSTEFVGSDRAAADQAIANALGTPGRSTLSIKAATKSDGGEGIVVEVTPVSIKADTAVLNIALVESDLTSPVKRGENGGRVLHHDHVVRWFTSRPIAGTEKMVIDVPAIQGMNMDHAMIIAYAQQTTDWRVLAGAATPPLSKKQ